MSGHQQVINGEGDAERYATLAFAMSLSVVVLGIVSLQYLLLSIRCSTSKLKPTSGEQFCLVVAFWVVHYVFDEFLSTVVDGFIKVVVPGDVAVMHGVFRYSTYNLQKAFASGPGTLLIREVSTTWFVHLSLVFFFDTVTPLTLNFLLYRGAFIHQVRGRFLTRFLELNQFANEFKENEGMKLLYRRGWVGHHFRVMRRCFDFAKFERCYAVGHPQEGRMLAWNLAVSPNAQEEIIDALQSIGQFGELGFHISDGRVYFEAMGAGTTLNLMIEMDDYGLVYKNEDHLKMA